MQQKQSSLKDVARKAGVGLGTASRVLNNHPNVSEETKKAVLKAISELNYRPNSIARSLKTRSTKTIGVIIADITNPFYSEILKGIEESVREYKYTIILLNLNMKQEELKDAINLMNEKKVEGVLYLGTSVDDYTYVQFDLLNIPVVFISTAIMYSESQNNSKFISIIIDNEKAAYTATQYLCKLNHKKIAFFGGEIDDPNSTIPRVKGYKRALKDNNIGIKDEWILEGELSFETGYNNMLKILKGKDCPTAIFAIADLVAMGAARALLEHGYKIPDDISIVGFDGIESTMYFYPSITTIEQPRYEMGEKGIEMIMKLLEHKEIDKNELILDFKLIERESCRKI